MMNPALIPPIISGVAHAVKAIVEYFQEEKERDRQHELMKEYFAYKQQQEKTRRFYIVVFFLLTVLGLGSILSAFFAPESIQTIGYIFGGLSLMSAFGVGIAYLAILKIPEPIEYIQNPSRYPQIQNPSRYPQIELRRIS